MSKQASLSDTWKDLEAGILHLLDRLNEGFEARRWSDMYTYVRISPLAPPLSSKVYQYCTSSNLGAKSTAVTGANFVGSDLYNRLRELYRTRTSRLVAGAAELQGEPLLQYYLREWKRFTTATRYINHIFGYLNRHWIKREIEEFRPGVYDTYTLSLVVWRDVTFAALKTRLTDALLHLIERDRNAEAVDSGLVQGVVIAYVNVGLNEAEPGRATLSVYKEEFEQHYLRSLTRFYAAEAGEFLSKNTVCDYMKKAELRLREEVKRVNRFMHESSMESAILSCEKVLVARHLQVFWDEFPRLLSQQKVEDLRRMYGLLSRIPRGAETADQRPSGLDPLRQVLEQHVMDAGHNAILAVEPQIVKEKENAPKLYVDALLDVYRLYSNLVGNAFGGDPQFQAALDKACRKFMNDNPIARTDSTAPSRSPELLAAFCNRVLRRGPRAPAEHEVDAILNDSMVVFKYLEDKDVFQRYYAKMLAKRLIFVQSASDDAEAAMLSKLKQTQGFEYTSKLTRMFTDMQTSKELNTRFREYVSGHDISIPGDFTFQILATGSWPMPPPTSDFLNPPMLEKGIMFFSKFYIQQHQGRKLTWLHQLGKGDMQWMVGGQRYLLQASVYQIAILLQYNNGDAYSVDELQGQTQLQTKVIVPVLRLLLQFRILTQQGALSDSAEIVNTSVFTLNESFTNKRSRLMINVPAKEEEKREAVAVLKTVEEDRKLLIQAAIVRLMKTRKEMNHSDLMSGVIREMATRFQPRVAVIKKCIDILIEKEYLRRDDEHKDQYYYVA